MNARRLRRAVALAFALAVSILRYGQMRLRGPLTLEQRALWMQLIGRAALASLQVEVRVEGRPPDRGLLVANHLSYFDIAALSAAMPLAFVARGDVTRWPLFGPMSQWGGAIYVDRSSLAGASAAASEISARLALSIPMVLFPEATSSDGSEVLRFRSRLFCPAAEMRAPITPAAVRYLFEDGPHGPVAEREACFYGDHELMSHLWKVLELPKFTAYIRFGEPRMYGDPREAAQRTYSEVVRMRAERAPEAVASSCDSESALIRM